MIHAYWEGPRHGYIDLCLQTMEKRSGCSVRVWDPEQVSKSFPDLVTLPGYSGLIPAHRADLLRLRIVRDFGGIWLDADTIVVRSLAHIEAMALTPGVFVGVREDGSWINGFIGSAAHGATITEWEAMAVRVLLNHHALGTPPNQIPWLAFGQNQSNAIMEIGPLDRMVDLGWKRTFVHHWRHRDLFFQKIPWDTFEPCLLVNVLNNNGFPTWFKDLSADEVLHGPWQISAMFRQALTP